MINEDGFIKEVNQFLEEIRFQSARETFLECMKRGYILALQDAKKYVKQKQALAVAFDPKGSEQLALSEVSRQLNIWQHEILTERPERETQP